MLKDLTQQQLTLCERISKHVGLRCVAGGGIEHITRAALGWHNFKATMACMTYMPHTLNSIMEPGQ